MRRADLIFRCEAAMEWSTRPRQARPLRSSRHVLVRDQGRVGGLLLFFGAFVLQSLPQVTRPVCFGGLKLSCAVIAFRLESAMEG